MRESVPNDMALENGPNEKRWVTGNVQSEEQKGWEKHRSVKDS